MLDGGALFVVGMPALVVIAWLLVKRGMPVWRALLWAGVGLYVLAAIDRLFFPLVTDSLLRAARAAESAGWSRANLVLFRTVGQLMGRQSPYQAVRQIGGNIGLLLPLGAVLPILAPRLRRFGAFLIAALAATLVIELVQYVSTGVGFMDRAFDVDDLVLNVFGAVLGYGLWWVLSGRSSTARFTERQPSDAPV